MGYTTLSAGTGGTTVSGPWEGPLPQNPPSQNPGVSVADSSGLNTTYKSSSGGTYLGTSGGTYVGTSGGTPAGYEWKTSHDPENTSVQKPLDVAFSSDYGYRENPITGKVEFHKGIDFAAPAGTDIPSATSGVVKQAGYHKDFGNYVVIQDQTGKTYTYAHMQSTPAVKTGSTVSQGTYLGDVGSTGNSTGNHLHFEIHDSTGAALDPVKLW